MQRSTLALLALLLLAIAVRMPGINRPLLGNFSTKNVVYAMIARNWAEGRASIWYPTLDVVRGGERSLHMVEFPASAYLTAGVWRTLGGSLDVWGRLTSVLLSAASVGLGYALVARRHGRTAALGTAAALALSPVAIIYGQSFMLEPSVVFLTLLAFLLFDLWHETGQQPRVGGARTGFLWLALGTTALALLWLTKVYMVVLLLPLLWRSGRLVTRRHGASRKVTDQPEASSAARAPDESKPVFAFTAAALLVAALPACVWYFHAYGVAEPGSPTAEHVFFSVRRSAADHLPPSPLLFDADFYRQVLDDVSGVVLTPVGFALLMAAVFHRAWRGYLPWMFAMLALVILLPRKFHEMNYYWMAVLPLLAVLVGLGCEVVARGFQPKRWTIAGALVLALVFAMRYAAKPAFVTPAADRHVTEAANAIRKLTSPDEPIITRHGTTPDLLYHADRPGWVTDDSSSTVTASVGEETENGDRSVAAGSRFGVSQSLDGMRFQGRPPRFLVAVDGPIDGLGESIAGGHNYWIYRLPLDSSDWRRWKNNVGQSDAVAR